MRKTILRKVLAYAALALLVLQSCKDDSYLTTAVPVPDQSLVEEFDTLSAAKSRGWLLKNRSEPIGPAVWVNGTTGNQSMGTTDAYSSKATATGFISTDYSSCAITGNLGEGTISNWVISPKVMLQNGDKIIFYARGLDSVSRWGDRLQVLINKNNDGAECGRGLNPGDFDVTLLDINPLNASGFTVPAIAAQAYPWPFASAPPFPLIYDNAMSFPRFWTRFEARIPANSLPKPVLGRFALRYFVPNGGTNGRGDHISLDSIAYVSASRK